MPTKTSEELITRRQAIASLATLATGAFLKPESVFGSGSGDSKTRFAVVGDFGGRTGFLLLTLGLGFGGLSYIGGTRAAASQASGPDDPARRLSLDKRPSRGRRALPGRDLGRPPARGAPGDLAAPFELETSRDLRLPGGLGDPRERAVPHERGSRGADRLSAPLRDRSRRGRRRP